MPLYTLINYGNLENFCTSLETSGFHTPSSSLAPRLSGQNCKVIFKVLLFFNSLRKLGYNETTLDISNVAYLDLICYFTECGMEFQADTPIVVKIFPTSHGS